MIRILALNGKMGSGKSTVFEMLQDTCEREVHLFKFAQPLYDMQRYIYTRAGLDQPVPKDRKLLQWLGTDWGRSIKPTIWGDLWEKEVLHALEQSPTSLLVCDDCRFENEAERIERLGGMIVHITAPDEKRAARINLEHTGHASEAGLPSRYYDLVIHNGGGLEELEREVQRLVDMIGHRGSGAV